MSPYLANILIYPIKSLDGVCVPEAKLLESGAIEHDREFALFDEKGKLVNGKRNAKVHLLRSRFDSTLKVLSLQIQNEKEIITFNLNKDKNKLENCLSDYFEFPVKLQQNQTTGFPDDTNARGPTIISTATIETVASWFTGISAEEMRRRLRANLEIGGVPPFWEDQLFTKSPNYVQFQIGNILLEGVNPCQRCVVPTRDSQTGKTTPNFQQIFKKQRQESLPPWTRRESFNHFYRLSVNTNIPSSETEKIFRQGDQVKLKPNT